MMSATEKVMRDWQFEVEAEMRRLIERGIPPFDAADQARNNVSARRRQKAAIEEASNA